MRKTSALFILISSITFSTHALAIKTACDNTINNPCLVQDTKIDSNHVKNLRDTQMMALAYEGNTTGLYDLRISGSAATSDLGWKATAAHIQKLTQGKVSRIIDLDLRQESHGYLNNNSINHTIAYNWINRGKSPEHALADESAWLASLASQEYISNVLTSAQYKSGDYLHGTNVQRQSILTEEETVKKYGFEYVRLMVNDHMYPNAKAIDRFVALVDSLPADAWIHIHCRGGAGRTTTFMSMYDMLKNAGKVSFDDIIKRQGSVEPFYHLEKYAHKDPNLFKYYQKRYELLTRFYQFSADRSQGYQGTWSDWIKQH